MKKMLVNSNFEKLSTEQLKSLKGGKAGTGSVCACQSDSDCSSMTKCGSKCSNGYCDGNG